jgi:hypothetical protein
MVKKKKKKTKTNLLGAFWTTSTGSDSNLPHNTLFKKVIFFYFRNMKNFYKKKNQNQN